MFDVSDELKTITDTKLDEVIAEYAASLTVEHPNYSILAARIAISNLYRSTCSCFSEAMTQLHSNIDPEVKKPLIADDFYQTVMDNKEVFIFE